MNKETCYFTKNKIKHVDYKSVELLKRFVGPHGNILSRKRSGLTAKYQRQVETAIKRARFMGLMPFIQQ
jgi:small subunit ribosomal protein S18